MQKKRREMTCSICLEELEDSNCCSLACGHRFHSQCAIRWLQTQSSSCPLCRHDPRQRKQNLYPDITWRDLQRLKKGLARRGSLMLRRKTLGEERKKAVSMQKAVVRARNAFKDADSSRREFFSDRSKREIFKEACRRRSKHWRQWRKVVSSRRNLLTYKASLGMKEMSGFVEVEGGGRGSQQSLTYDDMRRISEETGNDALFTHPTLLPQGGEFHFDDLQRWLNPLV